MVELDFEKQGGLVPAIVQDYKTKQVLMLGYMNKEAFEKTLATGKVTYYSRSRNKLWIKGETSGNVQNLKGLYIDCDNDTVLVEVEQVGEAACHKGYISCFYTQVHQDGTTQIIGKQVFDPAEKYGK